MNFLREEERKIRDNDFDNEFIIEFKDLERLYMKVNDFTFEKIWQLEDCQELLSSPRLSKCLTINNEGKFLSLLEKTGSKNNLIKQYYNDIIFAGTLASTNYATINHLYEDLELNNIVSRLLIAVHYITSFDNYLRYDYFSARLENYGQYLFSATDTRDWFEVFFVGSTDSGKIIFQVIDSTNNIIYKDVFPVNSILYPKKETGNSTLPSEKMNLLKEYIDDFFNENNFPVMTIFTRNESGEEQSEECVGFRYRIEENKWKYIAYSKILKETQVYYFDL